MRLPDTLDIKSGAQDEPEVSVNSDLLTSALDFSTVKMLEMEEIEENMDDLLLNEIQTKLQQNNDDSQASKESVTAVENEENINEVGRGIVVDIIDRALEEVFQ